MPNDKSRGVQSEKMSSTHATELRHLSVSRLLLKLPACLPAPPLCLFLDLVYEAPTTPKTCRSALRPPTFLIKPRGRPRTPEVERFARGESDSVGTKVYGITDRCIGPEISGEGGGATSDRTQTPMTTPPLLFFFFVATRTRALVGISAIEPTVRYFIFGKNKGANVTVVTTRSLNRCPPSSPLT